MSLWSVYILAVLVVVFADVAEVRCEGLHSQRTRDLPAFPLNDHTCHTHHKHRASHEAENRNRILQAGHIFSKQINWPRTPGTRERKRSSLVYMRGGRSDTARCNFVLFICSQYWSYYLHVRHSFFAYYISVRTNTHFSGINFLRSTSWGG